MIEKLEDRRLMSVAIVGDSQFVASDPLTVEVAGAKTNSSTAAMASNVLNARHAQTVAVIRNIR